MISVNEAKNLILDLCNSDRIQTLQLIQTCGSVLAESVLATIDTPPFHQSAMDGYAFVFELWDGVSPLMVIGEIQAGQISNKILKANEALRIFTGAAMPTGADTVVMQEKVMIQGSHILIQSPGLMKGNNVRLQGSQTMKGEIALNKGQLLTPAGISYLAGIGIRDVKVFKPKVSVLVTGKELSTAGEVLESGKIFESNAIGLTAALQLLGIIPETVEVVDDVEEELVQSIKLNLNVDLLILTGGVSVGDYDLVPKSLANCGVNKIFHTVKQKPGKPFYFGTYQNTLIFALPGNPAAVMTCFYEYIAPAISRFTRKEYFKSLLLPLSTDFVKKSGLTYFLKGKTSNHEVTILNQQESYLLNSFAIADCLIELEEDKEFFQQGEMVRVLMII